MPLLLALRIHKILFSKLEGSMNRMKAYMELQTNERIQKGTDVKLRDFNTCLLKAKDPEGGEGLNHAELVSENTLLMIAGGEANVKIGRNHCLLMG